jgi:hypothetical protein
MKTEVWIHQLDNGYPGAAGEPNDTLLPIAGVNLKSHDGLTWMSRFDSHPQAVAGPTQLAALKDMYEAQGIYFHAWCVPHGTAPETEAVLAGHVLGVTNILILDVEPYDGFWRGAWENLHPYMEAIRNAFPNAHIGLSFDPRPEIDSRADHIHLAEWAGYGIDSYWPQVYWSDFGRPGEGYSQDEMVDLLNRNRELLGRFSGEYVWTIPGNDPNSERFEFGCNYALSLGGRLSVWQRGSTSRANWDVLAAILDQAPEPEPPPEPPALPPPSTIDERVLAIEQGFEEWKATDNSQFKMLGNVGRDHESRITALETKVADLETSVNTIAITGNGHDLALNRLLTRVNAVENALTTPTPKAGRARKGGDAH